MGSAVDGAPVRSFLLEDVCTAVFGAAREAAAAQGLAHGGEGDADADYVVISVPAALSWHQR